ncbi:MAG: hypothetical protein WBV22_05185 [Anaerolineaceae bacterium]
MRILRREELLELEALAVDRLDEAALQHFIDRVSFGGFGFLEPLDSQPDAQ